MILFYKGKCDSKLKIKLLQTYTLWKPIKPTLIVMSICVVLYKAYFLSQISRNNVS